MRRWQLSFHGRVEFAAGFSPRPEISHVLFDFDGTLSLIREGWPEVMTPMFAEMLPALPGETEEARLELCREDILRLNWFGDGYVEIQNTKETGGLAVASDEAHNGSGRFDEWKRQRLMGVGADIVIPDFRDAAALLECIFAS